MAERINKRIKESWKGVLLCVLIAVPSFFWTNKNIHVRIFLYIRSKNGKQLTTF